jgi:hypothetical protein
VEVFDVLNLVVKQAQLAKPINVKHTVEVFGVLNLVVKRAQLAKPINVKHTEEVTDARIVLTGLIQGVVHPITMDIA